MDALDGEASEPARARWLFGAAHVAEARNELPLARALFEQSAELLRRLGEMRSLVLALTHLAGTFEDDDPARADEIQLEAIELTEQSGDRRGSAVAKGNLARHRMAAGDLDSAAVLLEEALTAHRARGAVYAIGSTLHDLALLSLLVNDVDPAADHLAESLELSRSIGDRLTLAAELYLAAATLLAQGDADAATRLHAAQETLAREGGFEVWGNAFPLGDVAGRARGELGARYELARAEGAELDLDDAVELALERLAPGAILPAPSTAG